MRRTVGAGVMQHVALLGAKMGHVHDRRRIVGPDMQDLPDLQGPKPLSGAQNGQGAQQAGGVESLFHTVS